MITREELANAREMLEKAARPLFFFDDDPDGLACFVMAYQFCKDGMGVCVKQSTLGQNYVRKVREYQPDLVVILDKPAVEREFFEAARQPTLWIDHHEPQTEIVEKHGHVTYCNPRVHDDHDNRPTSLWIWEITRTNLWMAAAGTVGDWFMPDFLQDVKSEYPALLPEQWSRVEDLYLDSKLGLLIKVLQFNLKGSTSDVYRSVKTLTRIERPEEILEQTTSRGRYIWRKYERLAERYDVHLREALEAAKEPGRVLLYVYDHDGQTFTSELSNELLIRYPDRITIVCRKHEGKRKCSFRSRKTELPSKVRAALEGLDGRGGGHTNACGCLVDESDWEKFYGRFEASLRSS